MFISRDPIGLMGGNNVFQYAPNPTGWVDPLGLSGTKTVSINSTACNILPNGECDFEEPITSIPRHDAPDVSRAEKYIRKWVCSSVSWEEAMAVASSEKMKPDFSIHPMDDDDRTSAEHYIFMRAMVSRNSDTPVTQKTIFRVIGPYISYGYQGAKYYGRRFGIYKSASRGSYSQLYWENKGYIDGMNPLNNEYEPNNCEIDE